MCWGVLLAGFGAVLSFFGLRSTEVTTILRNDPGQASFIALFLLLGVLAAVLTVVTQSTSKKNAPLMLTAGVVVALFGLGTLVIYFIPVGAPTGTTASLRFGLALISAGVAMFAASVALRIWRGHGRTGTAKPLQPAAEERADKETILVAEAIRSSAEVGADKATVLVAEAIRSSSAGRTDEEAAAGDEPAYPRGSLRYWLLEPLVPLTVIFILSSVIFIAISAYGGMRLETRSQLSFSSQVGAIFSMNGSLATVQVDITAAKIPQSDWVFLDVYALPVQPALSSVCGLLHQEFTINPGSAPCTTDPCLYFSQSKYQQIAKCTVLSNGSIVPNAAGDVDETVTVPFTAAEYQYVDVRAEVCSVNLQFCEGSPIGQNSRLDWAIPDTPGKPG